MAIREEFLLTEKYRPRRVDDAILSTELKTIFRKFVDQRNIPNLLMYGKAGMGKTTVAKAMCEELGCDYIVINGSKDGNIDTLRNKIQNFASSMSLTGSGRKYVILDEGDYLNPVSTQPALRNFMEEFSSNAGFIITCNYKNKIMPELHSRCALVEFKIPKNESARFASEFFKRVVSILDEERIEHDKAVVAEIVRKYFPDMRRTLNELQKLAALGRIDTGALASIEEPGLVELIEHVKVKNFTEARKWISLNIDSNAGELFRKFYDASAKHVKPQFVPALVMLISKYQYQASFVADQEVNACAFIAEVMLEGIYS